MKLRRLTESGIRQFEAYIGLLRTSPDAPVPVQLLEQEPYSEEIGSDVSIEKKSFASRYDLGIDLVNRLGVLDQDALTIDAGIWNWLALFYFDELCPVDDAGTRSVSRIDNYVLSSSYKDYNRHAIRMTYLLVREHGEGVRFMLSKPFTVRGELTEQLTGRSYFLSCKGIIEAARKLYEDPDRGTFVRGAASKKPGAARRFGLVVRQFELTYDVFSMNGDQILELLPREFDNFRREPV